MQIIWGNEVKEAAAAAAKERILQLKVGISNFLLGKEPENTMQRFPTWRLMWKTGTPILLRCVLHSATMIQANLSFTYNNISKLPAKDYKIFNIENVVKNIILRC